ncbi:MAG: tetracycline resistance MFS efflux pump [Planctomycetaceae bacterium]|nr:MAG: tetracycline resistance MFS efflux pump [Planctomycetaceae bacterium]
MERRSPLLIIFFTVFIDLLGFGIVLPLLPRYAEYYHASGLVLGLLMASFSAMQFIFAPLWGRLSDRIGRRPVLLVGLLGSAVFYFLFAEITRRGIEGGWLGWSPLTWLFLTRMGAGICGATIPTAQAYIADVTDEHHRGQGMALIGAAFGIGFTFGPLIGAAFVPDVHQGSPSAAPGYVASALSFMAFLWALGMLPESLKLANLRRSSAWFALSGLQLALQRPAVMPILSAIFLTTFAFTQFESTLSLLTARLELGDRSNFFIFAYIGLILALSQGFIVRRLIHRVGEFWMGLLGVSLMAAGFLGIGWASGQRSIGWLLVVLPITVMGFSACTPSLQALLSLHTPDDEQGGMLGVGQSLSALARILGPALALPLQSWWLPLPYWVGACLMILSAGLILSLWTQSRPPSTVAAP